MLALELLPQILPVRPCGSLAEIPVNDGAGGIQGGAPRAGDDHAPVCIDAALIDLEQVLPERSIAGRKHSFREGYRRVLATPLGQISIGDLRVDLDAGRIDRAGLHRWRQSLSGLA